MGGSGGTCFSGYAGTAGPLLNGGAGVQASGSGGGGGGGEGEVTMEAEEVFLAVEVADRATVHRRFAQQLLLTRWLVHLAMDRLK